MRKLRIWLAWVLVRPYSEKIGMFTWMVGEDDWWLR